jgi:exopolyphosphatase/guanosine-5'-triphosphate,3'-diphosphate pyrophosphatase
VARLGEGLQQTGQLSDAGRQRGISVFAKVVAICAAHGMAAAHIKAVATAAIREASNGQDYVRHIAETLDLHIQVIDGQEEAKRSLLGAQTVLDKAVSQDMLLFDIGGASTEFNRVRHGALIDCFSEKLGVVRLTELYLKHDPPLASEYAAMKAHVQAHLTQLEALWGEDKRCPTHLVGTAGTVTTLAAIVLNMDDYDAEMINNYHLSLRDFAHMRDELMAMTQAQRLAIPAIEKGREDVIIAGLAIVDAMFERWGYQAMITVDAGLLEGLLLD